LQKELLTFSKQTMKTSPFAFLPLLVIASTGANAALLSFEANQGYTVNDVTDASNTSLVYEQAGFETIVGPEVHTYSAGDGNLLHTDVVDNAGKFRNISANPGSKGDFWDAVGGQADTTYLAAHTARQSSGSVRPDGYVSGDQVLALRSDAKPFDGPEIDGPHDAKYAYTVDSIDLNGTNPNAIGNSIVALSFYTCVSAKQTSDSGGVILSTTDNTNFRALEMGFGGVNGDAAQIGWTDENNLAYYNGSSWIETDLLFDYKGYDQVSLSINTLYNTWSLSVNRGLNAYATENVVVDQPLGSTLGSSFGDITFTAIEDQDDGTAATKNGLAKTYFDNFAFTVVPEPSGALLGLLGCLGFLRRRR
jgi:hypothetical protein